MSVDPLLAQTDQAYIYVGDNPVNSVDPTGMIPSNEACAGNGPIGYSPAQLARLCADQLANSRAVVASECANGADCAAPCGSLSAWQCLAATFIPPYTAYLGYMNEVSAVENGCGFWQSFGIGITQGAPGLVATGLLAAGPFASTAEAAGDITISERAASHIFRDAAGHLPEDTAANRSLLLKVANNSANKVGTDQWGNDWYAQTQSDGSQVWVRVRNGQVTNGGVNATPWKNFGPGGLQR